MVESEVLPLDGVRVTELTNAMAAPACAAALGDWGAEVIRVESIAHWQPSARGVLARPSREFLNATRSWHHSYPNWEPGDHPWNRPSHYHAANRSKLSVTADLTTDVGRQTFKRLLAISDVFIDGNAPDVAERLGVTYADVSRINPTIIVVQMPAFGESGPYKNYRAYGAHAQAFSGLTRMRGYPDSDMSELEFVIPADSASATIASFAVLVALRHRRRTGYGQRIEVALSESMLNCLGPALVDFQVSSRPASPMGNHSRVYCPHNTYRCAGDDNWVNIVVRSEDEWIALCALIGDASLSLPELKSLELRFAQEQRIDARIGRWCRGLDAEEVMTSLQKLGIPSGIVSDAEGLLTDPSLRSRGFYQELNQPDTGPYKYPGFPFTMSRSPNKLQKYPPMLGEHNSYVHTELLGYSEEDYASMVSAGLVGTEYRPTVR
jgi:crotonobetainyl-CoA:carnitine CoA-transferase CaiB-like acyl-CoA transferase